MDKEREQQVEKWNMLKKRKEEEKLVEEAGKEDAIVEGQMEVEIKKKKYK